MAQTPKTVMLFGATGTIGQAAAHALVEAGHNLRCVVRDGSDVETLPPQVQVTYGPPTSVDMTGVDAVASCIASRTGAPKDAWDIDHDLQLEILTAAKAAGVAQFVLLSAICVQKPKLEFQNAKLAFEDALQSSGLIYSIVRPTAFFKSLSGQVKRVQEGKPFLLFGDGRMTACKPISDRDVAWFLTKCLTDPALQNQILPIGGHGAALTPRDQGEMIFELTGMEPKFRSLPVWVMDAIIAGLSAGGKVIPALARKSELAKIGRYYATESMLVWDGAAYDADATPSFGTDTLEDHYRAIIAGDVAADLGDHAVF